jgi:hypothetical protein
MFQITMIKIKEQSETEWLHSQLELIASNRALKCWGETLREYEKIILEKNYDSKKAIDFLKEKYEIER